MRKELLKIEILPGYFAELLLQLIKISARNRARVSVSGEVAIGLVPAETLLYDILSDHSLKEREFPPPVVRSLRLCSLH